MSRRLATLLCLALGASALSLDAMSAPKGAPATGVSEPTLFISPCGKPYRAQPGERDPVLTWFAQADLNHDGVLDRDEFRADATAFFKVLDQDNDGVIGGAEVSRYEHEIAPEVTTIYVYGANDYAPKLILAQFPTADVDLPTVTDNGFGGRLSAPKGTARLLVGAAPYSLLPYSEPVSSADLELNGRITLAEFLKVSDQRFARLDRTGQGKIGLKDLPLTIEEERLRGKVQRAE